MNKPKLAVDVDAERLVRDLLDAFSSLKAAPAAAVKSTKSAELRPEPEPPLAALLEPVSSDGIEAPKTQREIIDEFCAESEVLKRLQVTPEELDALTRVSMLGIMTSKQDLLFMLRQIREAANPKVPEETDPPEIEPLEVADETLELPTCDTAQMTDRIRREALVKLPRWQARRDAERRRAQVSGFFLAVGSVAAMAGRRVITTLKSS